MMSNGKKSAGLSALAVAGALAFGTGCGSGLMGDVGGSLVPNFVTGVQTGTGLSLMDDAKTLDAPNSAIGPFAALQAVSGVTSRLGNGGVFGLAGQAHTNGLKSLKYFIQYIQLCEDMTITGSGYSGTSGCVYLYRNPGLTEAESSSVSFYNDYEVTTALADTQASTRFSDLMTTEGLAALKRPMTVDATMKRTYKYGLINFMRVVKATAEFKDSSGNVVYRTRKNKSIYKSTTESDRKMDFVKVEDTAEAVAAEETTYMMNNGGTFFKFNQPFTISDEDVANKVDLKIDLVFNPENFGTAVPAESCTVGADPSSGSDGLGSPNIYDDKNCVTMAFPFAKLNPIPRKSGQKTRKEVYRMTDYYNGTATKGNVRIELYYNDGDANKSIQGIDIAVENKGASTMLPSGSPFYGYSATEENGVVKLLSYDGSESVTALTRRADGTAKVICMLPDQFNLTGDGCASSGATVNKAYTYVGDVLVSSD